MITIKVTWNHTYDSTIIKEFKNLRLQLIKTLHDDGTYIVPSSVKNNFESNNTGDSIIVINDSEPNTDLISENGILNEETINIKIFKKLANLMADSDAVQYARMYLHEENVEEGYIYYRNPQIYRIDEQSRTIILK